MEVVSNIKLLFNYKHAHMNYQVDLSLKQIKTDICYKLKIFSFEFSYTPIQTLQIFLFLFQKIF